MASLIMHTFETYMQSVSPHCVSISKVNPVLFLSSMIDPGLDA